MPDQDCKGCQKKRRLILTTVAAGGVGVALGSIPFIASMLPTDLQKALIAPVDVDIGQLEAGSMLTVEWRGQPVWVLYRTAEMMNHLTGHEESLADPLSERGVIPEYCRNAHRSRTERPEILVTIGVCTHLGCSPISKLASGAQDGLPDNWPGGFLCPCHGSTFDIAGRVFKNKPAPDNLYIPPYKYLSDTMIRIGEDETSLG